MHSSSWSRCPSPTKHLLLSMSELKKNFFSFRIRLFHKVYHSYIIYLGMKPRTHKTAPLDLDHILSRPKTGHIAFLCQ